MYLYLGRAGLVCLLVLLASLSLPAHAKSLQPGHTKLGDVGGGSKDTPKSSSKEPPTVTTTPQAMSTERGGKSESTAATVAVSPSEGPKEGGSSIDEGAAAKKEMPEEFLYFQVTKCISRRNLTLGDIEDVLRQKNDDGSQFSFMLADKLGYIIDDKFDDPHIPVIKSHKEKLVTLLEAKKKSLMASSQHKPKPVPAVPVHVSDEPPQVTSETVSDNDIHRIGFDVSKAILQLGPEAINRLLNDFSLPGTLGYAVGQELGYSNHDVHMEYLEKLKDDEVVASLQRILKSKLPNHPGDGELSPPTPSPPTQRPPPSREDVGDSESEDDNEGSRLPGDLTDDEQVYNYDVDDNDDLHAGLLSGIDEEKRMKLVQSEGFQNYLATKYNELYEQFFEDRADPDKLGAVLEEYIEWKSEWSEMAVNEKGGGGSDGSYMYKEIKSEAKQDATAQPLDSDKVEGELGSFDDEEDEYDRPRSSSFGAWHFLSIFIVLCVVVVVGYIIMHNRKKLHEGVTSYINDLSKRRKRAGEYKPLIST